MSPILSATLISCFTLIFFSFLTTRLDQSIKWNWFLVFVPMFFLQSCFLIDNILLLIKNRHISKLKLLKLTLFLISNLLLLSFEILLCLKLEYFPFIRITFIFVPIWALCLIIIAYLFVKLMY
jgi:hypothetical protein